MEKIVYNSLTSETQYGMVYIKSRIRQILKKSKFPENVIDDITKVITDYYKKEWGQIK